MCRIVVVGEFLIDILLPKTDRVVLIQTVVMAAFWLVAIPMTWNLERNTRQFVWGLAMLNLGWFAVRTVH